MLGHEPSAIHTLKSILNFVLFAALVAVGTIVLVRFTQGYRIDLLSGDIQEFGRLVTTSPIPESRLTIADVEGNFPLPYEENLEVDNYSVRIEADRFRAWETNIDVQVGEITTVNSVLQVPTDLNFSAVTQLEQASFSPDRRTFLALSNGALISGVLARTVETRPIATETEDAFTGIERVVWSADGSTALVAGSLANDESVAWLIDVRAGRIVSAVDPEQAPNITHVFTDASYVRVAETVSVFNNQGVQVLQRPLDAAYSTSQSKFSYIVEGAIAIYDVPDGSSTLTTPLRFSDSFNILNMFEQGDETFIVYRADNTVRLISDAENSPLESTLSIDAEAATPSFSYNRLLLQSPDDTWSIYDIETKKLHALTDSESFTEISWLDGYRVQYLASDEQTYHIRDYNGFNDYLVGDQPLVTSPDRTKLYNIVDNDQGALLQEQDLLE